MLQGRDQDRKLRIDLLYATVGGLEGVRKRLKVVKMDFGGYFISSL